eukprot:COSAG02_NODE_11406_length_1730_cov_1.309013_1_plen_42_part_10
MGGGISENTDRNLQALITVVLVLRAHRAWTRLPSEPSALQMF